MSFPLSKTVGNQFLSSNAQACLFNRQPQAYADAATNVRLRLTVKRNPVQIVAEQRELPGECLQNAGSPDGLRRIRYYTGRSLNGIAVKRLYEGTYQCRTIVPIVPEQLRQLLYYGWQSIFCG